MQSYPQLRILHILSQRPDATGSGIYLQAMVREAASRGHANFVIAGIQLGHEVEIDGIDADHGRFVRFDGGDIDFPIPGMTDIMPYPNTRFKDLSAADLHTYEAAFARFMTAAVMDFAPDLIHSHHLWLVSSLARRLFPQIPVVASCHGTDLRQFQNCPHLRSRVLSGCGHLDAALALSRAQKADIEECYGLPPHRVIIAGAGYNETLFTPSPKPRPDPVQLVYAGKLIKAKGLPWLLKALAKIHQPDWRLHLVGGGSGPEKEECLSLARALGNRVVVHGQITQSRLAAIFRQSHIFVLSSFFEGLPLVILEALASGCRVVATDLPGVREVAQDLSDAYITMVPTPRLRHLDQPLEADLPSFEHDIARGLKRQMAITQRQPQLDRHAIHKMLATYTWRGTFERIEKIYRQIIATKYDSGA